MFDSPSRAPNVTAWLIYDQKAPKPEAEIVQEYYDWDDINLVPLVPLGVAPPDHFVTVTVNFTDNDQDINYAVVNNVTYQPPNVPTMFTALTSGAEAVNPAIYGNTTNSFVLKHLDMIYFVINNHDTGGHPCNPALSTITDI
jgi:iron transport multicopper oxidase